ncbi:MAG: class I SAM-dependent methyltransferase family protein [Candidatus Bathyarchaeota archaeon]|nr:class I SAM-dependent methyltransferase family protein [Candidatus Bathyarchaeota archaeon]
MFEESFSLKVARVYGEKTLTLANKLSLLDRALQIRKDPDGNLHLPISREPDAAELELLQSKVPNLEVERSSFSVKPKKDLTLSEALQNQLPESLLTFVPRALDQIGDIAILELPAELEAYKSVVGEAVLQVHKNIHVVLAKAGAISGTYRIRDYEFLAGENRTRTLYKEYDCTYHVDVAKAYFSPRLSNEHSRVAALTRQNETIADLFAGVGPFAVPIAKNNPTATVYAIDINAEAIALLHENIKLNHVENQIRPLVGDARQIVHEKLRGVADRVIMNLPESANEFVGVACDAVKPSGGIVHFYGFVRKPDTLEDFQNRFVQAVKAAGRKLVAFEHAKTVRETAPYECQAVLDAQIH